MMGKYVEIGLPEKTRTRGVKNRNDDTVKYTCKITHTRFWTIRESSSSCCLLPTAYDCKTPVHSCGFWLSFLPKTLYVTPPSHGGDTLGIPTFYFIRMLLLNDAKQISDDDTAHVRALVSIKPYNIITVGFHRRNDDVAAVVLQARAHETGTTEGRHARRTVRVQAQGRQQRGLHRRPVLRADVQRVLQVCITQYSSPSPPPPHPLFRLFGLFYNFLTVPD